MKLMLKNVRLAFPNLFTASRVNGEGEAAFSATFIMEPKHPAVKELENAFVAVAKEKWGPKAEATLKALKATDKVCLHNGDTKSTYEGFEGNMYVAARSKVRPTVVNRDRSPLTAEDGKPYSGCYVVASIELWAQDNKYGKRINAQLRGVQFYADGDAFSGGGQPASDDEFDDLAVDAEPDPLA